MIEELNSYGPVDQEFLDEHQIRSNSLNKSLEDVFSDQESPLQV